MEPPCESARLKKSKLLHPECCARIKRPLLFGCPRYCLYMFIVCAELCTKAFWFYTYLKNTV